MTYANWIALQAESGKIFHVVTMPEATANDVKIYLETKGFDGDFAVQQIEDHYAGYVQQLFHGDKP